MSLNTQLLAQGVFCEHGPSGWQQTATGKLAGQQLAVKDVFAVKGERNTAGNPSYYAQSEPIFMYGTNT